MCSNMRRGFCTLVLFIGYRALNKHAYSVACERQRICGDFPEKTAFKSYAAKHEFTGLPAVNFFRSTHSEAPEVTQRVSTTFSPKRCLLILLARVGARTKQHNAYSYDASLGVVNFPRTRIGLARKICS